MELTLPEIHLSQWLGNLYNHDPSRGDVSGRNFDDNSHKGQESTVQRNSAKVNKFTVISLNTNSNVKIYTPRKWFSITLQLILPLFVCILSMNTYWYIPLKKKKLTFSVNACKSICS